MSSGYSRSVTVKDGKTWAERNKVRSGLRHRLLMLWPPYRRADMRRAQLRRFMRDGEAHRRISEAMAAADYFPGWETHRTTEGE